MFSSTPALLDHVARKRRQLAGFPVAGSKSAHFRRPGVRSAETQKIENDERQQFEGQRGLYFPR